MLFPYDRKLFLSLLTETPQTAKECDEVFASVAWSILTEPGDQTAGALINAVGATAALMIVANTEPENLARHNFDRDRAEMLSRVIAEYAEDPHLASDREFIQQTLQGVQRWRPRLDQSVTRAALKNAHTLGVTLLHPGSSAWPTGFELLGNASPQVLWLRGNPQAIQRAARSVAIVGARAASAYGEHVTYELTAGMVAHNIAVVSGGAYGIDGVAHRAALAASGTTVAVLAGGIDRLYPSGHQPLLKRIIDTGGAVIAEQAPGFSPSRWRFLQRNRLMAAASLGTLVVEAGIRSGSLNTAGHAAQIGKPLGAVPGPITSSTSLGPHRLIREYGAECITSVEELCEMLSIDVHAEETLQLQQENPDEGRVLDQLTPTAWISFETIVKKTGMAPDAVEQHLALLEFTGQIRSSNRGWKREKVT